MAAKDTAVRERLRRQLEEVFGVEETDLLLDRPPGGWNELVTKEHLHLELAVIDSRFESLESRMESGFETMRAEFAGLRDSVDARYASLHAEFGGLQAEFGGLQAEFGGLRAEFGGLRAEFGGLRAEFGGLRETVDSRFSSIASEVSTQINKAFATQLKWLLSTMIAFTAVLVAVSRL